MHVFKSACIYMYVLYTHTHTSFIPPCRASGDGGLGDLLKLSPLKEASHSPPSLKETTTATSLSPSSSSTLPNAPATLADGPSTKSPTSALANHLIKNLSIKSPPISLQSKLSALPKHLQVSTVKGGSKVCKTSSLLASAMKFHSDNDGLNSILDGSPDPIPGIQCVVYRNSSIHVKLAL